MSAYGSQGTPYRTGILGQMGQAFAGYAEGKRERALQRQQERERREQRALQVFLLEAEINADPQKWQFLNRNPAAREWFQNWAGRPLNLSAEPPLGTAGLQFGEARARGDLAAEEMVGRALAAFGGGPGRAPAAPGVGLAPDVGAALLGPRQQVMPSLLAPRLSPAAGASPAVPAAPLTPTAARPAQGRLSPELIAALYRTGRGELARELLTRQEQARQEAALGEIAGWQELPGLGRTISTFARAGLPVPAAVTGELAGVEPASVKRLEQQRAMADEYASSVFGVSGLGALNEEWAARQVFGKGYRELTDPANQQLARAVAQSARRESYNPATAPVESELRAAYTAERTAASRWGRDVGAPGSPAREREVRVNVVLPAQAAAARARGAGGGEREPITLTSINVEISRLRRLLVGGFDEATGQYVRPLAKDDPLREQIEADYRYWVQERAARGGPPVSGRPVPSGAGAGGRTAGGLAGCDTPEEIHAWITAHGPTRFVAEMGGLGESEATIEGILRRHRPVISDRKIRSLLRRQKQAPVRAALAAKAAARASFYGVGGLPELGPGWGG